MIEETGSITNIMEKNFKERESSLPAPKPISVYLLDNNKSFLGVASNFLSTYRQLRVEGSSTSPKLALEEIARLRPDVVVVDLVMPEMNGLEATRWIKKHSIETRVIVVSLHDYHEYRTSAMAVGADDFLTKTEFANEVMNVINRFFLD